MIYVLEKLLESSLRSRARQKTSKHFHFDAMFSGLVAARSVCASKCRYLRINLQGFKHRPYGLSCSRFISIPLHLLHFPSFVSWCAPSVMDNVLHGSPGVPAMGTTVRQFPNFGGITHWQRRKCGTARRQSLISLKKL